MQSSTQLLLGCLILDLLCKSLNNMKGVLTNTNRSSKHAAHHVSNGVYVVTDQKPL
ncbi:hypothetical protein PF003_g34870 [Phytophthora fragariae]|nr:hypothetical protein PF003_g34870 [Phytophthora fragariae]